MAELFTTKGPGIANFTYIVHSPFGYPHAAGNQEVAITVPNLITFPAELTGSNNEIGTAEFLRLIPTSYVSYIIKETVVGYQYVVNPDGVLGTGSMLDTNPIIGDGTDKIFTILVSSVTNGIYSPSVSAEVMVTEDYLLINESGDILLFNETLDKLLVTNG